MKYYLYIVVIFFVSCNYNRILEKVNTITLQEDEHNFIFKLIDCKLSNDSIVVINTQSGIYKYYNIYNGKLEFTMDESILPDTAIFHKLNLSFNEQNTIKDNRKKYKLDKNYKKIITFPQFSLDNKYIYILLEYDHILTPIVMGDTAHVDILPSYYLLRLNIVDNSIQDMNEVEMFANQKYSTDPGLGIFVRNDKLYIANYFWYNVEENERSYFSILTRNNDKYKISDSLVIHYRDTEKSKVFSNEIFINTFDNQGLFSQSGYIFSMNSKKAVKNYSLLSDTTIRIFSFSPINKYKDLWYLHYNVKNNTENINLLSIVKNDKIIFTKNVKSEKYFLKNDTLFEICKTSKAVQINSYKITSN